MTNNNPDGKLLKPPQGYTNKEWQDDFKKLKFEAQSEDLPISPNFPCGLDNSYDDFLYSVLYTIRHGRIDYCYYIYQIVDLLKYEKNLQSRWLEKEQQFRVWL